MRFNGTMHSVKSSNIAKIGFSKATGPKGSNVLRILFTNGRVYDYYPVPEVIYKNGLESESIGNWFRNEVQKNVSISYKEVKNENRSK